MKPKRIFTQMSEDPFFTSERLDFPPLFRYNKSMKNTRKEVTMGLFGIKKTEKQGKKPRAAAFVDFEHWAISLHKNFAMKPDIRAWYKELSRQYELVDVFFFGDFSNSHLRTEISKIREITTGLIETQNTSAHYKKDFTDFIMLDHIYQRSFQDDLDAFILFTGDGHFSSVVSYLVNKRHKTVEIFGIDGAISTTLKNTATKTTALPTKEALALARERLILSALKKIYEQQPSPRPTYLKTIQALSEENGIPKEEIQKAMDALVEKDYVYQTKRYFRGGNFAKILALNTVLLKNDGIWDSL